MRPYDLRIEHRVDPWAVDVAVPRFSWRLAGAGPNAMQRARRLVVETIPVGNATGTVVWDSGRVRSTESHLVEYGGPPLPPHTGFRWRVQVWDGGDRLGPWSRPASFATGFQGATWPGCWITVRGKIPPRPAPAWLLRRRFRVPAAPVRACLYATACGWFEPWLNGARIGDEHLAPGWTDYRQRIEYLCHDVTSQVRAGDNVLGAWLGDGWACSRLMGGDGAHYAERPALRVALRLAFSDGSIEWIGSDRGWQWRASPIGAAGLYEGEHYDARREVRDWCTPGSGGRNRGWRSVQQASVSEAVALTGKCLPPVRTIAELLPRTLSTPQPGVWIFDLGQNMTGVVRLRVRLPRGTRLRLRHGEMLQADGTLYTENLRTAAATDVYVCRGGGMEEWSPRFTFHGFRFVELTGFPGRPALDTVTGLVWSSDLPVAGDFSCSQPLLNRLQQNIQWSQRGNFLDVPTDCPQRNERLGWSADAQVFAPTALFNAEAASFFVKYCRDLREGRNPEGAFPDVAPEVLEGSTLKVPGHWRWFGNAGWADAGVIIPWVVFERTGDRRVLEENYEAMAGWVRWQERTSRGLLRPDTNYGDWVATDATRSDWAPTPCDLIGTAYFAHSTDLTARTAELLGRLKEARRWRRLHGRIVRAFQRAYVAPSGRLAGDTQTAYCLALAFDLLPVHLRSAAVGHLRRALARRGNHLSTGFLGTPLLCPVLTQWGAHDLACQLLRNEDYPSWLMPVKNGATTMWERWNSWTPEKGFGPVEMNSFNHYAFGAVGDWIYRSIAGLDCAAPGYRRLRFRPRAEGGWTRASAWHRTPYGRAASGWRRVGRRLVCSFEVPANTTAEVILPAASVGSVTLRGPGEVQLRATAAGVEGELCPGRWRCVIEDPVVKGGS